MRGPRTREHRSSGTPRPRVQSPLGAGPLPTSRALRPALCSAGCAAGSGSGSAGSGSGSAAGSGSPVVALAGDKVSPKVSAGAKVSAASVGSAEDSLKSELFVSSADMKLFKSVCLPESTDSDATRAAAAKELGIDPIHKAYFDLFSRIPEPNTCAPFPEIALPQS